MLGTTRADVPLASVLVVDDAPAVRNAARAMLEFYGYEVFTAESGAAAILELEELQGNVGLIMLDYRLPDMKAAEVVVAFRRRYPAVKILLVSSYAHEEIDVSLTDLPFLQKPLRFSDIGDIVANFVYARALTRPRANAACMQEDATYQEHAICRVNWKMVPSFPTHPGQRNNQRKPP